MTTAVVAVDRDIRQPGKVREPAGNRRLMAVALQQGAERLIAGGAGQAGAAVEHAIFGINGFGVGGAAGIGAGRMAGDEIVDFKPILDGAQALFERWFVVSHRCPPNCDFTARIIYIIIGLGRLS